MLNINYDSTENSRSYTISKVLKEKERNPGYRVIDVGGIAGGSWTKNIADMVIDINATNSSSSMRFDICDDDARADIKLIDAIDL